MIETDILYAFVKKEDWLKETAKNIFSRIIEGEFGEVFASRESLHELYYVSIEEGVSINEIINRCSTVTAIQNLTFIETTFHIDLFAITLMRQYGFTSVFDAYYAATALNQVEDHNVISTDKVFDCLPGIIRIDPRKI